MPYASRTEAKFGQILILEVAGDERSSRRPANILSPFAASSSEKSDVGPLMIIARRIIRNRIFRQHCQLRQPSYCFLNRLRKTAGKGFFSMTGNLVDDRKFNCLPSSHTAGAGQLSLRIITVHRLEYVE